MNNPPYCKKLLPKSFILSFFASSNVKNHLSEDFEVASWCQTQCCTQSFCLLTQATLLQEKNTLKVLNYNLKVESLSKGKITFPVPVILS